MRRRAARAQLDAPTTQFTRDAPRGNMSPVWIVLALLPILGGAERFNCRGRILGAYYADVKAGCKAFHVCVRVAGGGIRDFRFFCPPGTLFHQEAQTCTDWGDDDPLACPADIYDGQFDLYKIGSAYDTKKQLSSANREDEAEYSLQRAETGDRRLLQNKPSNSGASDLRTAHSSDFFSGQRDRGRDEPVSQTQPSTTVTSPRQPYRRPTTTPQATYPTTQFTTPKPTFPPQSTVQSQYDQNKRKAIRKRPVYVSSTPSNLDSTRNTYQTQNYYEQQKRYFTNKQQTYSEQPKQETSRQSQNYLDQTREDFSRQQQSAEQTKQDINRQQQRFPEQQKDFNRTPQTSSEQTKQNQKFNNNQIPPNINLPPQYQDEYVEVPRVSPKNSNRYYPNNPPPSAYFTSTHTSTTDSQKGLVELYNYESQSTPGIKTYNENKPFKVKNSFNVETNEAKDVEFTRARNLNYNTDRGSSTAALDFNSVFTTSTPSYRNFNSISYDQEKNNFVDYSSKQSYYSSPATTASSTTLYTTARYDFSPKVNTIAYNTNIGFDANQSPNYAESLEDDGQYRPPQGEDDGQYRPELYEKESELLTGAHSLNIAASNRLPEDQKQSNNKLEKSLSKNTVPRPFRPAPTPFTTSTTPAPETNPTTLKPRFNPSTPRHFDYYQTYTTTSRPYDLPSAPEYTLVSISSSSPKPKFNTEPVPKTSYKSNNREIISSSTPVNAPKSTRPPQLGKSSNKKEESSYDYAYYDSDPGFSEYDHIEEFGKTKSKY